MKKMKIGEGFAKFTFGTLFWMSTFAAGFFWSFELQLKSIYVTSIPKCGTHLLRKCVQLLTDRMVNNELAPLVRTQKVTLDRDHFFQTHLPYENKTAQNLRENKISILFIYRDPRDQVISRAFWIYNHADRNAYFKRLSEMPMDELLHVLITKVHKQYDSFMPWQNELECCAVKYEDLVGPQGGGDIMLQRNAIKTIARHVAVDLTKASLEYCLENLYGDTVTFRKGSIGDWKNYFTQKHIFQFKKYAGQLLIDLGYETSMNW